MADIGTEIAVVALVVSLVALFVTTLQFYGQIFATAEGTRKCSDSVMGPWSKHKTTRTRWRWRWSEGRFETLFVTPEIFLSPNWEAIDRISHEVETVPDRSNTGHVAVQWLKILSTSRHSWWNRDRKFNAKRRLVPNPAVLGFNRDLDYLIFRPEYSDLSSDLVGWISFLAFVLLGTRDGGHPRRATLRNNKSIPKEGELKATVVSWPYIIYKEHSWDFMPPDAAKPFASTTLSDIAIIVRRTGMVWKEFDLSNGNLRAEGGPHVISSTVIRGLGLVLQYQCLDESLKLDVEKEARQLLERRAKQRRTPQVYQLAKTGQISDNHDTEAGNAQKRTPDIDVRNDAEEDQAALSTKVEWNAQPVVLWSKYIDKMMFGLVPIDPKLGTLNGDRRLDIPDFVHTTFEDCLKEIVKLNDGKTAIRDHLSSKAWCQRYEFNDLLVMAMPVLRQRGADNNSRSVFTTAYYASVFFFGERSFIRLLEEYLDNKEHHETEQMRAVLEMAYWLRDHPDRNTDTLDQLHEYHDETTRYFIRLADGSRSEHHKISFLSILKAHFSQAPYASWEAREKLKRNEAWGVAEFSPTGHRWRAENMFLYFQYIPYYIKYMAEHRGCDDGELVTEAWLTLMLRAHLHRTIHAWPDSEGPYIPAAYYGSRSPVWLA